MAHPADDNEARNQSVEYEILPPASAEAAHDADAADDSDIGDAPRLPPRNSMANSALFLGLASLLINRYLLTSIAAIIFAVVAIRRAISIYRDFGVSPGRLPATIGLSLGVTSAVFWAIMQWGLPESS